MPVMRLCRRMPRSSIENNRTVVDGRSESWERLPQVPNPLGMTNAVVTSPVRVQVLGNRPMYYMTSVQRVASWQPPCCDFFSSHIVFKVFLARLGLSSSSLQVLQDASQSTTDALHDVELVRTFSVICWISRIRLSANLAFSHVPQSLDPTMFDLSIEIPAPILWVAV